MVLYLKLDQHQWAAEDFTDSSTYDISGTVYRDSSFSTAETSLDTFTGSFRLIDEDTGVSHYENNQDLTLVSDGTFTLKITEGRAPYTHGGFNVRLKLEKSGSKLTAKGFRGSDYLFIGHN